MIGAMKKTFHIRVEGKHPHPDRVLDAIKHEIRKYIKRERAKALPEGADFWDFDCRFGLTPDTAEVIHPATLTEQINQAHANHAEAFYVELLAKPVARQQVPPERGDVA
jgi:hypothetical protein